MTFHFRAFWGINFLIVAILAFVIFAAHESLLQANVHGAWAAGAIGGGICAFLLYVNFITCTDLVVTDDGLFRQFFGARFQYIKWSNVELIMLNKLTGGSFYEGQKVITICPRIKSDVHFGLRGRISVGGSIDGYLAFKRIMNEYINKYDIDVKIDDGATATKAKFID